MLTELGIPMSNEDSAPQTWDADSVRHAFDLEMIPEEGKPKKTPEDIAQQKLRDAVALAADGLVWTALYSQNETLRTKAQVEILNRVFGRVTDMPMLGGGKKDALTKLLEGVVTPSGN